jgi:Gpi18-like mannosyltransferase
MPFHERVRRLDVGLAAKLVLVSAAAFGLRYSMVASLNTDVDQFIGWLNFIRDHDGWHALKYGFNDYTPFYSYLLLVADTVLVGARDVVIVKISSILADFVCAAFVYRIVRLRYPEIFLSSRSR